MNRLISRVITPLLAVLGSGALMATVAPAAARADSGATVTGSVTVPTGVNAANVHVILLDTAGSEVATATVADNRGTTTTGTYTFPSVVNGTYKVYLLDPTGADDVAPAYYGGSGFNAATPVTISGSYTIPAVTLGQGGEISGTVTDPNPGDSAVLVVACQVGNPEPGQTAYWSTAANGSFSNGEVCEGDVPTAGVYSFGGLVPGAGYTLLYTFANATRGYTDRFLVDGTSLTADTASATDFTAPSGAGLTAPFSVPALGSITGTATDPGGSADIAMNIQLYDAAGTELTPSVTFSGGGYTIAGLLPGSYNLEFLPDSSLLAPQFYNDAATLAGATAVNVGAGSATPNVNASFTSAAQISGTVTAAQGGASLGGLAVDVLDSDGNQVGSAVTAADGSFTINALPAGTWYLRFAGGRADNGTYYATSYYGGSATLAGSAPVVLTAGESLVGVNQAVLVQSTTASGAPRVSAGALSGLYKDKVALRFALTSGSGAAGYLRSFAVKLPKHISWNKGKLAKDLVVTAGTASDPYTYVISGGALVVTFTSGTSTAAFDLKAGGIRVSKAIKQKAKARKLATETIKLSATDTTGLTTALEFIVKRPR